MLQAMKIPDAEAAFDKEWEKLEKLPAWRITRVRSKKEVIQEAQKGGQFILQLWCMFRFKKSELEQKFQKYKGRVVLRVDVVKDHFGSYAAYTEEGSSASQMRAACTRVKMEDVAALLKLQVWVSRHPDTSTTTQVAQIMGQHWRTGSSSWAKFLWSPTCSYRLLVWETNWKKFYFD